MKKVWGIYWTIITLLGCYTLWATWRIPSETKNAFLLGMSKSKIALCAGIVVLILICLVGAISSFLLKENGFSTGKCAGISAFILTIVLISGVIFLTPPVGKTAFERSVWERLTPVFIWAAFFVLLSVLILLISKNKEILRFLTSSVSALVWGFLIFILMAGAFVLALRTGIGIDPISGTFYRQGVSLLEGHLIVPLLFLYLLIPLFMISERNQKDNKKIVFTIIFFIVIWAAAVWLWQTTQFEGRSYFAPALRPPNYNYYPSSDAENYDLLAQSIILGNGFRNGMTVVRPLYAAFLALLHTIFGNDYIHVTNGQIVLLALIPAIVFLIAKQLRYPAAGLASASWIIWREIYSIRLTPSVQVSNSRLLMSDLPTLLMIALVILFIVKWCHSEKKIYALFCGGMIGTAMLLRTQCFVLIPALLLVFFCSSKITSIKWLSVLISLLGVIIVFCPWLLWGKIHPNTSANSETSEGHYLQQLYRNAAGETDKDTGLLQIIIKHPAETLRSVSAHFLNNEISSVLILPMRLNAPENSDQLFYEGDLFWYRENAHKTIEENLPLVGIYLLIIAIGITGAVRKNSFTGLIPFVIHIVYNLGNAFAMTSGFRFILPSDWIILFYFALGCVSVMEFFNRLFLFNFHLPNTGKLVSGELTDQLKGKKSEGFLPFFAFLLFLAVIGSILPLCDAVIPQRFSNKSQAQLEVEWIQSSEGSTIDLSQYQDQEIVFLEGRAIYPRFYKAGEGDSGGSSSAKRGLDSDRIVWMFHDQRVHVLNYSLTEDQVLYAANTKVPDPMDVLVVGIRHDDYVDVLDMHQLSPKE